MCWLTCPAALNVSVVPVRVNPSQTFGQDGKPITVKQRSEIHEFTSVRFGIATRIAQQEIISNLQHHKSD